MFHLPQPFGKPSYNHTNQEEKEVLIQLKSDCCETQVYNAISDESYSARTFSAFDFEAFLSFL